MISFSSCNLWLTKKRKMWMLQVMGPVEDRIWVNKFTCIRVDRASILLKLMESESESELMRSISLNEHLLSAISCLFDKILQTFKYEINHFDSIFSWPNCGYNLFLIGFFTFLATFQLIWTLIIAFQFKSSRCGLSIDWPIDEFLIRPNDDGKPVKIAFAYVSKSISNQFINRWAWAECQLLN